MSPDQLVDTHNEMFVGLLRVIIGSVLIVRDVLLKPRLTLYFPEEYVSHLHVGQLGTHVLEDVVPSYEKVM